MRLDYASVKKYVRLECKGTGKGVVFHEKGSIPTPFTDGHNIHVFVPDGMWDEDTWSDWEYEVYHEIGHEAEENSNPHWKDHVKELGISLKTLIGSLLNLMSDHIQEHNRVGKYIGRDRILKRGRARFVNNKLLDKRVMYHHMDTKNGSIFKVVSIYDTLCRESWNEWLVSAAETAASSLDGDEKVMWDKLYTSGIKIQDGKNERDAYAIAKKILEVLGEDVEEHEKAAKDKRKSEEASKTKSDGDGEKVEVGEGDSGTGDGTGVLGEKDGEEVKSISYHTHYSKPKPDEDMYNTTNVGSHIRYEDSILDSSKSFVPKDPNIVDLKTSDYGSLIAPSPSVTDSYVKTIMSLSSSKVLSSQVKKLLISMKQLRWEHGNKRGHISSKNLWKGMRPVYEDNVFKKRAKTLELNTAVTVLTDNSGSMGGSKFYHAAKAGLMLNEAMSKVGIPVELLSFSEVRSGPVNVIVKGFTEYNINEEVLANRYAQCTTWMSQNSDGESIMWAFNRLKKRKEKRRLLIVLSDGSPAAYNGESGAEYVYTARVIKEIEDSPIEIYGIGIMDRNVEKLYKEYKIINSAEELEDMLIGLVKQKIMR